MNTLLPNNSNAARGLLPRFGAPDSATYVWIGNERKTPVDALAAPSSDLTLLLVDVLFAAQYDNPEKQDRQYGTNDSNH